MLVLIPLLPLYVDKVNVATNQLTKSTGRSLHLPHFHRTIILKIERILAVIDESSDSIPEVAKAYKAAGSAWVVCVRLHVLCCTWIRARLSECRSL